MNGIYYVFVRLFEPQGYVLTAPDRLVAICHSYEDALKYIAKQNNSSSVNRYRIFRAY